MVGGLVGVQVGQGCHERWNVGGGGLVVAIQVAGGRRRRDSADAEAAAEACDPDLGRVERVVLDSHRLHEVVAGDLGEGWASGVQVLGGPEAFDLGGQIGFVGIGGTDSDGVDAI